MIQSLITFFCCTIVFSIIFLFLSKKQRISIRYRQENEGLLKEQKALKAENDLYSTTAEELKASNAKMQQALNVKQLEYTQTNSLIAKAKADAEEARIAMKDIERQRLEQDICALKQEYNQRVQNATEEYNNQINALNNSTQELTNKLNQLKKQVDSITEINKNIEKEATQKDFYRLQVPQADIDEIKVLRSIMPQLRDKVILNKLIYKTYYEKPYNELIGRTLGSSTKTGIYKITCLLDGKCYIGQAVGVQERWRQHIKRGLGAEAATKNKLYPAMYEIGPENFTFELIEECSQAELNEREDYYQEFYHAIDYGYSIK